MNATITKISLLDWNNDEPITYLWIAGVGCPTGQDFRHNTETEDEEEYCDFAELMAQPGFAGLWELEGTIDEDGSWKWDGKGDPRDARGNSIYNVKASR